MQRWTSFHNSTPNKSNKDHVIDRISTRHHSLLKWKKNACKYSKRRRKGKWCTRLVVYHVPIAWAILQSSPINWTSISSDWKYIIDTHIHMINSAVSHFIHRQRRNVDEQHSQMKGCKSDYYKASLTRRQHFEVALPVKFYEAQCEAAHFSLSLL